MLERTGDYSVESYVKVVHFLDFQKLQKGIVYGAL